MTPFYRCLHILVGWFVRIIFNIKVVGRKNEPSKTEGPFIVCANHISASDPVAIGVSLRHHQPHYLAKAQLFKTKIGAWLFRNLGCVPVNRSGNDVGALKTTINLIKEGKSIGIFPQGTRQEGKNPRDTKIKGGAGMICAYSGASVLPIYIHTKDNTSKLFRRKTLIIGKLITREELAYVPHKVGEYDRISKLIFDRICDIGEEYLSGAAEKKDER